MKDKNCRDVLELKFSTTKRHRWIFMLNADFTHPASCVKSAFNMKIHQDYISWLREWLEIKRSNHLKMFFKKFLIFLRISEYSQIKLQACEYSIIFQNSFFYRTSPVVASGNTTGFLFFCKHLSLTLLPLSLKAGYTLLQWYQFSIGNWCWLNSGLRISIKWAKVHRSRVNRYGTLLCKGLSELIKNPGIEDNDI